MRLPGFTAEVSLSVSERVYQAARSRTPGRLVRRPRIRRPRVAMLHELHPALPPESTLHRQLCIRMPAVRRHSAFAGHGEIPRAAPLI